MNVGIGIMAMPSAFYNSGMVVGIGAMAFMAIITVHCMHLLVKFLVKFFFFLLKIEPKNLIL